MNEWSYAVYDHYYRKSLRSCLDQRSKPFSFSFFPHFNNKVRLDKGIRCGEPPLKCTPRKFYSSFINGIRAIQPELWEYIGSFVDWPKWFANQVKNCYDLKLCYYLMGTKASLAHTQFLHH
jgi:hypothetical protein